MSGVYCRPTIIHVCCSNRMPRSCDIGDANSINAEDPRTGFRGDRVNSPSINMDRQNRPKSAAFRPLLKLSVALSVDVLESSDVVVVVCGRASSAFSAESKEVSAAMACYLVHKRGWHYPCCCVVIWAKRGPRWGEIGSGGYRYFPFPFFRHSPWQHLYNPLSP